MRKLSSRSKPFLPLVDEPRAQILNYLAATGCKLGLLVNFGHYPRLEYERLLPRNMNQPTFVFEIFALLVCFVGKQIFNPFAFR